MAAQGQLPANAPAHEAIPPEGFVQTLMHNLVSNTTAFGDSGIIARGVAGLLDVLNAPHAAAQAAVGVTPESQMRFSQQVAPQIPAPSWMQLLSGPMGMGQFGSQLGQAIVAGTPISEATGRHWSPETINMGLDIVGDPTSYIGLGLFKKLGAEAAAKVGAPKAVVAGLKAAQVADEFSSDKMGAVAEGIINLMQKGLIPVNRGLVKQFPELAKWTDYYKTEQGMGQALQWLEQKRGIDLPTMQATVDPAGPGVSVLMNELPTQLRGQIDAAHLEQAVNGLSRRTPPADVGTAFEQYRQWLRKDMGLNDPAKFAAWYGKFNDWFKNQALGSLNYLLQNLQGGAAMGQMVGVDAPNTLATALENSNNIARGIPFHTGGAEALGKATDMPIPFALHEQADRALASRTGTAASANPIRDAAALGILGGVGAGPAGALMGAAIGSRIGAVSERIRKSSQGIETVLRERGWEEGMSRALVDSMAQMEQIIVDGLTRPGARASGSPVHQNFMDILTNQIKASGGQIKTSDIRRTLLNSVRTTTDRADEITRALDDVLYNASQKGIDLSNKFNFDYQDLSALERVISEAFPFSTWTLKAAPFFAEQGARHPLIGNLVRTERNTSAQEQTQGGLPSRFGGTIPSSTGSSVLSAILGRPVEFYNDPLRGFMPFSGAGQALQRMQYHEDDPNASFNPISHALDLLDVAGLGLGPVADTALRVSGLSGEPSDPARGYIRWAGPAAGATALASRGVEAVTGQNPGWNVDINRGPAKIEEVIRQAITGQRVTVPLEVSTEHRLDELALRDTGKPIGSNDASVAPYVRARRTQSGPLWERAKAEVELEKGVQAISGFISQGIQPQAILTPEEAAIRKAKAGTLLEPATSHTLDTAAERDPQGLADEALAKEVQGAAAAIATITGIPTPPIIADKLAQPTNANIAWVAQEVYKFQVEEEPLLRGYGASGTPEARQIGNDVGAMAHAGQGLDPQTVRDMIIQNQQSAVVKGKQAGAIHAALQIPNQERTAIKNGDPLLQEYLAWKGTHPGREVADFLAEKFSR
jgi:hypothetical protein